MSSSRKLGINEYDRDRYARTAQMIVGGRPLQTPHFSPLVKSQNPDEMGIFLSMLIESRPANSKSCVVRLFDAKDILGTRFANIGQTRMDDLTRYVEEPFVTFRREGFPIIDPATEYLYYEHNRSKWSDNPDVPQELSMFVEQCVSRHQRVESKRESSKEYLKWKEANHRLFWNQISRDAHRRNTLIGESFDIELKYGSPFMLPPVPLITGERLLEIAIQINRVATGIGAKRDATFANYFILPSRMLANRAMISTMLEFVRKSRALANAFKFKYLDLSGGPIRNQLNGYRDFLQEIALLRQKEPTRAFLVLDNGYQAFASAAVAFDVVSTSITGQDLEGGFGHSPYGWWFDPEEMIHISFEDTLQVYHNSGNMLPCGHAVCRTLDLDSITPEDWNVARRRCYFLTMCRYMTEIGDAISDRKIELAFDKLNRSDLVRLRKLIPRT